jgi:hypothetical protein
MKRFRQSRARSGAMLVQVGFVLLALLTFVALAVDVSLFYLQRAELEVAATSAAAGAAIDLSDNPVGTAVRLAEVNLPPALHGTVLASSDVEVGNWKETTRVFTANATPANAVRVTTRKSSARGNAAQWLAGSLFGLSSIDLSSRATAVLLPELPGAIGATGSISITGNVSIDSYSSSEGSYDPALAGEEGDVVTSGDLSFGGSSIVNGDAKGATVSVSGGAQVTGETSDLRRPLDLPPVDATAVAADNDNDLLPGIMKGNNLVSPLDANRNFTLSSGVDYDIPPGAYYFNDLKISGQSSLRVSGPTTIYLTGDLDTSGGDVINSTEDPNNLRIFMTGGSATINASIDWYGLLYAPTSDVSISGSADIYGAIIGENVFANGTGEIHFDTSLTIGDEVAGIVRRSRVVQ